MGEKTLLLFELFLAAFAFYAVWHYPGTVRLLIPLACLVSIFAVARIDSRLSDRRRGGEQGQAVYTEQRDPQKGALSPLDCVLKSKNVHLLGEAIHYLMQDLGLAVSLSRDYPDIDRVIRIPNTDVSFGLKILSDVEELDDAWEHWEELAHFDLGKGGKRRLIIIGSNCAAEAGDREKHYKDFSAPTQQLLSAKRVVAMTTLTLGKIYNFCKKKNIDPRKLLHLIQNHPGGVFQLENYLVRSK
jgi:hypothetical protein